MIHPTQSSGVLLAVLVLAAACGGDSSTEAKPTPQKNVVVQGTESRTFVPPSVTVSRGDTVTFQMVGARSHDVIFQKGSDSAPVYGNKTSAATGQPEDVPTINDASAARVFRAAGNFAYRCALHAGMAHATYLA